MTQTLKIRAALLVQTNIIPQGLDIKYKERESKTKAKTKNNNNKTKQQVKGVYKKESVLCSANWTNTC